MSEVLERSETKHTPGPWKAHCGFHDVNPELSCTVKAANGARICDTRNDANARLIASAPELLAALEAIRKLIDVPGQALTVDVQEARVIARAAIAKATGAQS